MGFLYEQEGIAASIFLAFYVIYTVMAIVVVSKNGCLSLYTNLLVFGLIRLGAQISGIGFAYQGIGHYRWLIAYLVLGAEGYFILILAVFHLIAKIQRKSNGYSWLDNNLWDGVGRPATPRVKPDWKSGYKFRDLFHQLLVVANVMIIVGGTMLTSVKAEDYARGVGKVQTSKALRSTGQAMFLAMTAMIVVMLLYILLKERARHPSLYIALACCPFLIVRGVYGVLSIFIDRMNYFLFTNYQGNEGLKSYFLVTEYCMSTTMEFIAAILLLIDFLLNSKRQDVQLKEESYSDEEM